MLWPRRIAVILLRVLGILPRGLKGPIRPVAAAARDLQIIFFGRTKLHSFYQRAIGVLWFLAWLRRKPVRVTFVFVNRVSEIIVVPSLRGLLGWLAPEIFLDQLALDFRLRRWFVLWGTLIRGLSARVVLRLSAGVVWVFRVPRVAMVAMDVPRVFRVPRVAMVAMDVPTIMSIVVCYLLGNILWLEFFTILQCVVRVIGGLLGFFVDLQGRYIIIFWQIAALSKNPWGTFLVWLRIAVPLIKQHLVIHIAGEITVSLLLNPRHFSATCPLP